MCPGSTGCGWDDVTESAFEFFAQFRFGLGKRWSKRLVFRGVTGNEPRVPIGGYRIWFRRELWFSRWSLFSRWLSTGGRGSSWLLRLLWCRVLLCRGLGLLPGILGGHPLFIWWAPVRVGLAQVTVGSAPILVWFSSAPPGNPHGRWLLLWLCLLRTRRLLRLLGLRGSRLLSLRWLRRGLRWTLGRGSLGLLGWASLRRARRRLR